MDKFVVGFAFADHESSDRCRVLLVRKNRPEWQRGYLNGIGGKIEEDESPEAAMERECHEETGLALTWQYRGILNGTNFDGNGFECHLFYAFSRKIIGFEQKEDESLGLYNPRDLSGLKIVDSLDFLIPYGLSKDQKPFMTLTY